MSNAKMLIDATHPEETRVVVLRNNRVEEFDYESAARKLLRGNIYLAKVTRVEPSLQAAFVEYGGNRHGFLAFNEIHPDYYQIPMADRQALLDEEAAEEAREEAEADARAERMARRRGHGQPQHGEAGANPDASIESQGDQPAYSDDDMAADEAPQSIAEEVSDDSDVIVEAAPQIDDAAEADAATDEPGPSNDAGEADLGTGDTAPSSSGGNDEDGGIVVVGPESSGANGAETVEQTGAEDALEELPSRPRRHRRSYKIQEVIKRRQVILVQVVKEERGNKGAALTTYLSLAGRYTVLMPNTARGGGISRKITQPQDRKRLKAIAAELEVPEGMGLIIRTAGASRTKQEIKRDFEYLLRLWESVRDLTLASSAPSLVYEEGNLIKRSIRDLYNKDVEEIIVAGEHAHRDAKDFMRMLMPSHTKNVIAHQEHEPLFMRYGIERQLNAMFSPYVTLRSGGYLVINQTEALVAIDVNSGKATREFSIEETALNTNLEAADEIARQLKLRDLAGLIVIDFIDMEEKRNNRAVERRLKDALRFDRARIQLGHISHFGLMEMSRQRLRSGVLEGSTSQCPHCQGTGIIRSTESVALAVLRGLEDALMGGPRASLVATTTSSVALYILNNKRNFINDMETRYGISVTVQASDKLQGANFTVEKGSAPVQPVRRTEHTAVNMDWGFDGESEPAPEEAEEAAEGGREREDSGRTMEGRREDDGGGRRRRRRGRRGRGDRNDRGERGPERGYADGRPETFAEPRNDEGSEFEPQDAPFEPGELSDQPEVEFPIAGLAGTARAVGNGERSSEEEQREGREGGRRRRRGRRGGRRGRDRDNNGQPMAADGADDDGSEASGEDFSADAEPREEAAIEPGIAAPPAPVAAVSRRSAPDHKPAFEQPVVALEKDSPPADTPPPAPRRSRSSSTAVTELKVERVVVGPDARTEVAPEAPAEQASTQPTRRGWWQRTLGS